MAEERFLRELYSAYAASPTIRFRHLAKTKRNAEIVRRHAQGETLVMLADELDISQQRVWRIIQRYG